MPDPTGTAQTDNEYMTLIKNCNGQDYWIITHEHGNKKFKAFPLRSNGIGSPIISATTTSTDNHDRIGSMRSSPNGLKIATASTDYGVEMFNFNPSTGSISFDYVVGSVNTQPQHSGCYGLEFSPNGNFLYYVANSGVNSSGTSIVYRHTVNQPNLNPVALHTQNNQPYLYAIQHAPDGNLYIAQNNTSTIPCITSPNTGGIYNPVGISLPSTLKCQLGLPVINYLNTSVTCAPNASFIFTNEGQTTRSVNSPYGPQTITEVCLPNVYIDGSASINENNYHLNISQINVSTWTTTTLFSNWICTNPCQVPSSINLTNYASLPPGDYLISLSVGPVWHSQNKLLRTKNCTSTASFNFNGNICVSTANENSFYGPIQVTSVGLPTVNI
ncbi:MAG: hypothetical protein ACRC3B_18070, partial [Bacteroidia bacterium]